jgi:MazG family protein
MARLRDPDGGCPWDRGQSFASIAPYTIEEAYEVADAIARDDLDELRDELGDLLFQVVFHAQMAQEQGAFDFDDVAQAICDKMLRRHPHVFAETEYASEAEQFAHWEQLKAEERASKSATQEKHSAIDGVALALPALSRAAKLQKRAARVGFDWDDIEPVYAKVEEEIAEVRQAAAGEGAEALQAELGDLLFAAVNLARHHGVDPEIALRGANDKFARRFRAVESALAADGIAMPDAGGELIDQHWEAVKRAERGIDQ